MTDHPDEDTQDQEAQKDRPEERERFDPHLLSGGECPTHLYRRRPGEWRDD